LTASASTAVAKLAVSSLPISDPTNGGSFFVGNAEAKALGLLPANGSEIELAIEDLEETQAEQETKAEIAAPPQAGQALLAQFIFEPIRVNANAPHGACVLRTFDDIGAFILLHVDIPHRLSPHWQAVRQDLIQARSGARRAEVHAATREALLAEGWLAE
jgi:hypothetical protein